MRSYHVVYEAEAEGGYTVIVPALPGCITYGRTKAEASRNAREAIRGYLEDMINHGEELPEDNVVAFDLLRVAVPA